MTLCREGGRAAVCGDLHGYLFASGPVACSGKQQPWGVWHPGTVISRMLLPCLQARYHGSTCSTGSGTCAVSSVPIIYLAVLWTGIVPQTLRLKSGLSMSPSLKAGLVGSGFSLYDIEAEGGTIGEREWARKKGDTKRSGEAANWAKLTIQRWVNTIQKPSLGAMDIRQ